MGINRPLPQRHYEGQHVRDISYLFWGDGRPNVLISDASDSDLALARAAIAEGRKSPLEDSPGAALLRLDIEIIARAHGWSTKL